MKKTDGNGFNTTTQEGTKGKGETAYSKTEPSAIKTSQKKFEFSDFLFPGWYSVIPVAAAVIIAGVLLKTRRESQL